MKRVVLLFCLLALAGTSFAGFSLGFKHTLVPTYVYVGMQTGDVYFEDVYMLRLGFMASPTFRLEALVGYGTESFELDPSVTDYSEDGTIMALGGGGYYVMEAPANTSFSIGAQVLYAKTSGDNGTVSGPETTAYSISPLMRIDFAIPGAERLAFFTEYGIRWASATTTIDGATNDAKWSGWQTYSPSEILAGAYYVF